MFRASDPRQQHGDDTCAETHLRLTKHCALGRYRNVAGERQFKRAGEAIPLRHGDGRFRAVPEFDDEIELQHHLRTYLIDAVEIALRRGLKIEAGGECAASTLDNDGFDAVICREAVHRRHAFVHHLVVKRV